MGIACLAGCGGTSATRAGGKATFPHYVVGAIRSRAHFPVILPTLPVGYSYQSSAISKTSKDVFITLNTPYNGSLLINESVAGRTSTQTQRESVVVVGGAPWFVRGPFSWVHTFGTGTTVEITDTLTSRSQSRVVLQAIAKAMHR
jgi:hypothetical protein